METPFHVGNWQVIPKQYSFCRDGEKKKVEPRVMRVLVCLAETPGQVVSRTRLLDFVWGETSVNEDALSRAISDLRKTLGDSPKSPTYIETIPKSGYRLIAQVRGLEPLQTSKPVSRARRSTRLSPWWLVPLAGLAAFLIWRQPTIFTTRSPPMPPLLSAKPLTSYPGHESFPNLSPDGRLVAFSWGEDTPQERFDIYVKALDQETPIQLTAHPGYESYPVWAPDGLSLAFVRAEENGSTSINRVSLVGSQETKLLNTKSWVAGMDWSPDGRYLVMAEREAPDVATAIFRVSLEDRQRIRLTTPPETMRGDYTPCFSPDGRHVAFLRRGPSNRGHVMVVPSEGGQPRTLLGNQAFVRGMAWLPDGRHLLVSTYRGGRFGLWRVALEGGRLTWVPGRGEHIFHPTVARNGNRLTYETGPFKINVWQLTHHADGLRENPLIQSNRLDNEATFSPDGDRIAFVSARSGNPEIWLCKPDGAAPKMLTHFEGPQAERPLFSPDGRHLAFATQEDGRTRIYTLDLDGGVPKNVLTETSACLLADWSRDGQSLYLGSDRGGRWQVWRFDLGQGEWRQATWNGGLMAHESPDGSALYFTKPLKDGIWRLSKTGHEERVVEDLSGFLWGTWTVHPQGIYYGQFTRNGPRLRRYHPSTGETIDLGPMHEFQNPGLSVSPDGRRILFSRVERGQSDLMLAETTPE